MTRLRNPRSAVPVPRKRSSRANGRGGTLLGVFLGLVLGLGLAAGVAYYVTKANSPYAAQAAKDVRDPGKLAKADAAATDKPRFDFYKILPGGEEPKVQVERRVLPDRTVIDQAKDKDAERVPAKVAAVEPQPKSTVAGDRFWLQAGSFSTESDAENLKAQLALAGWEAAVQQGTLPEKGVRYRVRLGPYDNTDELKRIKTDLGKKGFDVAVIKY
jgi:cell division protein FtsN